MCTVVIFILHVCVSCGFLRGSLQLSLLCFCIIMLCVQTVTYSARIGVCSSRNAVEIWRDAADGRKEVAHLRSSEV